MSAGNSECQPGWVETPAANVARYKPSGSYFARVRIQRKHFQQGVNAGVMRSVKASVTTSVVMFLLALG